MEKRGTWRRYTKLFERYVGASVQNFLRMVGDAEFCCEARAQMQLVQKKIKIVECNERTVIVCTCNFVELAREMK